MKNKTEKLLVCEEFEYLLDYLKKRIKDGFTSHIVFRWIIINGNNSPIGKIIDKRLGFGFDVEQGEEKAWLSDNVSIEINDEGNYFNGYTFSIYNTKKYGGYSYHTTFIVMETTNVYKNKNEATKQDSQEIFSLFCNSYPPSGPMKDCCYGCCTYNGNCIIQ